MSMKWWTVDSKLRRKGKPLMLLVMCAVLVTASGCSLLPKETDEEVVPVIKPPKISQKPQYTVKTDTLETRVRAVGKLMSTKEESLFFTLADKRVKNITVQTGDQVKAGQVIAELDITDLENQLRQKNLSMRSEELKMKEILRTADELTPEELEQKKIDFELARTDLLELQQKIDQAKIIAPFDGTIVSMSLEKGQQSKAYESVAVIADLSKLTVAAEVSKDDLSKIAVGMDAVVDINSAGSHKGKVKTLPTKQNDNNNQGGSYDRWGNYIPPQNQQGQDSVDKYLLVQLDQFPAGLSRGTPLSVSVTVQRKENAIVIPTAALRSLGGRNYVQVVESNGTKREVDVQVGMQDSTQVEIVKGLEAGQKVVGK